VAQGISDGLLVVGADGLVLTCNPAACTALGVTTEQLVGTRLSRLGFELQHMDDGRPVSRQEHPVTRVMSGAGVIEDLYRLRRPDGKMMQVRLNVRTLFERVGSEPTTCLVAFRDVTAQRAAEEALKRAEERWLFAIDGAREGVWDYSEDTKTMFFSRRWKEMIGYEDEEIGSEVSEWTRRIHPDDKPRVMQAVIDYRRGVTAVYETEHRLQHKLGHWIWVLDRGKIVERAPDGRPRRVVGTQTDITQMKLAEQTLRDQQALALASRAKTEFLSRMSHEMRTPLNAVIGFTQLLQLQRHTLTPSKVEEFAGHVMAASQHLLGLVNDVLDLQRVEDGSISLELGAVGVKDLVESTLTLLQPLAQQARVALEAALPEDAVVRADRRRLQQVLINLMSNAIKYNRPQGWVRVTVEDAPADRLRIAIEDGGRGMSAEQLSRLFQPFERLGRETSSVQGSGLGLVIARRIAEEMGCALTLDSVQGRGTIARIDLPIAPAQDRDTKAAVAGDDGPPTALAAATAAGAAAVRVLYVEDNPVNAIVFEEAMRLCPQVELRVAATGGDALTLVGEWPPDVLVLDASLPDMSGFDLLERLRSVAALSQAPAYMCSAAAMPEDLQRAREAGFTDYWVKPIDISQVVSALNALALSFSSEASTR
jgi:PAS domain S-box-containing protein